MISSQTVLLKLLIDVLLFFLELENIFNRTLEDRALVLIAVRHKTSNLVDTFINSFAAATFN
jgi:hypothetical protein